MPDDGGAVLISALENRWFCPSCWKLNRAIVVGQRSIDKRKPVSFGYRYCVMCENPLKQVSAYVNEKKSDSEIRLLNERWKCRRKTGKEPPTYPKAPGEGR